MFTVTVNNCELSKNAFSVRAFSLEPELEVNVIAFDPSASEAGQESGSFVIMRSGSKEAEQMVSFHLGGTAINGTDYNQVDQTITILAGRRSVTVEIIPIDDQDIAEADETVILTLIDPVNGGVSRSATLASKVVGNPAVITIINNANLPASSTQAVPTLQEWALILLSILLLMVSWFYSRKREV